MILGDVSYAIRLNTSNIWGTLGHARLSLGTAVFKKWCMPLHALMFRHKNCTIATTIATTTPGCCAPAVTIHI